MPLIKYNNETWQIKLSIVMPYGQNQMNWNSKNHFQPTELVLGSLQLFRQKPICFQLCSLKRLIEEAFFGRNH